MSRSGAAAYDPGDLEELDRLIAAKGRTPRAVLERRGETAGELVRRERE